jgi:fumarate reductase flavoprotein subunit
MLKLALCVAYGALQRQESRGAHSRQDYPLRDDKNWLKRTLATWKKEQDNLPTLDYESLDITKMEMAPGWRGYGTKDRIDHPDTPLRQAQIEKIQHQFAKNDSSEKDENINAPSTMQEELMPYKHLLPPLLQGDNERLTEKK